MPKIGVNQPHIGTEDLEETSVATRIHQLSGTSPSFGSICLLVVWTPIEAFQEQCTCLLKSTSIHSSHRNRQWVVKYYSC